MASATASTKPEPRAAGEPAEVQEWRRGLGFGSLRARIFAVNLFAVIVLALMLLYIDTVRARLLDERSAALSVQAATIASLAAALPFGERVALLERQDFVRGTRLRLYGTGAPAFADNWRQPRTHRFIVKDPSKDSLRRRSAKAIDRMLEAIGSSDTLPGYWEPASPENDTGGRWDEVMRSWAIVEGPVTALRRARDGAFIITAAAPITGTGFVVHLTDKADDLTRILRAERLTSFWLLLGITGLTALLSFYLARTIVRPLRMLAIAAHRVRLGRSREVIVPRLPERRAG